MEGVGERRGVKGWGVGAKGQREGEGEAGIRD